MKFFLGSIAAIGFFLLMAWSDDMLIMVATKIIGVIMLLPLLYFGRNWNDDEEEEGGEKYEG